MDFTFYSDKDEQIRNSISASIPLRFVRIQEGFPEVATKEQSEKERCSIHRNLKVKENTAWFLNRKNVVSIEQDVQWREHGPWCWMTYAPGPVIAPQLQQL